MRKSTFLFLVSLLIGYFYASPALAQRIDVSEITSLPTITPDFQVNENTGPNGASQYNASIATDGGKNYIITWQDERNGDLDIYAQRYSNAGTPMGSNFKVSDDMGSASQSRPSVAADGSANFIITWRDFRNGDSDIYAQQYSSAGTAEGSNFKVNDDAGSASQYNPSIATDGSGNFIISWSDSRNGDFDIYAQRYSGDGTAMGSNFKVPDDTSSASQSLTSIAADGSGNFIITWRDYRNGASDIYAQRYSSDGTAVGSNFKVTDDEGGAAYQRDPAIETDGSGNYIITWRDYRNGTEDIYAQRYSSDGTAVGSNFEVTDDEVLGARYPSITADGSRNFIITWYVYRDGDWDIYAQRYSSDGTAVRSNFKANDVTGSAFRPSIAAGENGNFIIAWYDRRNGDSDIYAQPYSSDGTAMGVNFKVNDDAGSANQDDPSIATDGSGNFIISWRDSRNGHYDIYAQRYSSGGTAFGSNFKVNDVAQSADFTSPSIAADSSGNFVITWIDSPFPLWAVYAQRYSSDGTAMGSNFKVNESINQLRESSIAADDAGNFIIAWAYCCVEENVYARRYASDGTALGSHFKVNDDTGDIRHNAPSIAADGSGNFMITWRDGRDGDYAIFAQRYSNDGTAAGNNFKVNESTEFSIQPYPSIAADGSGNFIITWTDSSIYAQRYSGDGIALESIFKVNENTDRAVQDDPSIAAEGNGNFIITWEDERNASPDIYAQRYSSDGTAVGGNFRVTNTSEKIQRTPDIKLWNNRIYTAWTDNRIGGTGFDIWANILDWDNPVGIRDDEPQQIPSAYRLHQNYPNPFNPSTTIRYSAAQGGLVQLAIYDELGRLVRTLVNNGKAAGEYSIIWDGKNEKGVPVASGTYFYTLKIRKETIIAKTMLLLR